MRPLRVAQVAPPLQRVPPPRYGGTERIVYELAVQLDRRGHDVSVFASGDSEVPGRLIPTVAHALWADESPEAPGPWFIATISRVLEHAREFDLIHAHIEEWSILLARTAPVPVVATFHGRLDYPWFRELLVPPFGSLVAISESQASVHPHVPWSVIHHGLSLEDAPFDGPRGEGLCFVGRIDPEKGVVDAIEIAKRSGRRLKIAARIGATPEQRAYHEEVFKPALEAAGSSVEFLGEIGSAERQQLFAESYGTLVPGDWPEPFGLVVIESLACGTPVIARAVGALPEIVRKGIDGFFGDDVQEMAFQVDRLGELDRGAIRASVLERFSATRMVDAYEELYASATRRRSPTRRSNKRSRSRSSGARSTAEG